MTSDDWAKERAEWLWARVSSKNWQDSGVELDLIATALQEAEQRGEYHEGLEEGIKIGRQSILDRLKEPDEALVEAVADALHGHLAVTAGDESSALVAMCALALALEQERGQE